tara:strand:+ start:265 stop:897 length:633 start_codon:yes stop_codon:yes gene_type:complete
LEFNNLGFQLDFVILDTEYTTWEGALERMWNGPNEERELVQISAIRVSNYLTLNNTKFFSVYTKPQINPVLSDYFIKLTGIEQNVLENNGVSIEKGIEQFSAFSRDSFCLCWGDDVIVLENNLELIKSEIKLRFSRSADIRKLFENYGIDTSKFNSGTINEFSSIASIIKPGKTHNALSDCISILSSLTKLEKMYGEDELKKSLYNLPNF